jgi:hypothetical protein
MAEQRIFLGFGWLREQQQVLRLRSLTRTPLRMTSICGVSW